MTQEISSMALFGAAIAVGADEIRLDLRITKDGKYVVNQDEVLFEEVLKKFSCHAVMNIHLNTTSEPYDDDSMKQLISLIRQYDCEKYVYFTLSHDEVIKQFKAYAPDLLISVKSHKDYTKSIVDRAIELGARKVELSRESVNEELIKKAHDHGIICNLSWSDDMEESKRFFDMGIDTILTNDVQLVIKSKK